ncbi:MAG TPA: formylglycine-generating enzyme family protein [Candidatus Binatia bacterium]|jgi:formylglycine-generating enzyme required for sulfatase activity|nr:formylglycine-generating enzyme family protein [Candidatus Binatia bacterium]
MMTTPDIVVIPEGSFFMGSEQGQENEQPRHRVCLDRFGIGRFPVTNREYKRFVEATHTLAPPFCCDPIFSDPEQPAVGVNWPDAIAYCRWLSDRIGEQFRLPTEAEWERAARGGREGALYPWGDEPPWEQRYIGCDPKTGGPARVGVNAPNDFGLYDMSEGVHEWCSDYYDYDYYRVSPERNPQGPASGARRASRGGSWRHRIKFSRCAARSSLPPSFKYADYGFRVALTLR